MRGIAVYLGALALIATTLVACGESARETRSFESANTPTDRLTIRTNDGHVIVQADPTVTKIVGTVKVRAEGYDNESLARDAVSKISIVESGPPSSLQLTLAGPATSGIEDIEADLFLRVPPGITVSVFTENEPIEVIGLPVLDLTTDDDYIELTNTSGNARIRNEDGQIRVLSHIGDIDARTRRAEMRLLDIAGNVQASTSQRMIFASVNPPPFGYVELTTSVAGIDLALPMDWGAMLWARTTAPGGLAIEGLDWYEDQVGPGIVGGQLWDGQGAVDLLTTEADIVLRPY